MTITKKQDGKYYLINYWDVIPMVNMHDRNALKRAGYSYFGGIYRMPDGKNVWY
jgi:hypothetical protein